MRSWRCRLRMQVDRANNNWKKEKKSKLGLKFYLLNINGRSKDSYILCTKERLQQKPLTIKTNSIISITNKQTTHVLVITRKEY